MISKTDKELILQLFKQVDVKQLNIDHADPKLVKWFRFGSFNGLQIAANIINNLPEKEAKKIKIS